MAEVQRGYISADIGSRCRGINANQLQTYLCFDAVLLQATNGQLNNQSQKAIIRLRGKIGHKSKYSFRSAKQEPAFGFHKKTIKKTEAEK